MTRLSAFLYLFCNFCLLLLPVRAQADCGIVERVQFPVNRDSFTLRQDYGVRSVRHEGRFHLGEDWYGGRDNSMGQAVQAAANGRVTYASDRGWGADGGVIIIEHTLPDERIFYTVYGHLMSTGTLPFPDPLSCVAAGQVIGAIADVRPAPHLHFEVRLNNPDSPGPGYLRENPTAEGWRRPSQVMAGLQAELDPATDWYVEIAEGTQLLSVPPLQLNDNSLLILSRAGEVLRRITADGRILWRQFLEKPAVSITGAQGNSILTYADGTMEIVDPDDGVTGDVWQLDARFTGAPVLADDWLIFPAAGQRLVAVDETRRNILWEMTDIPSVMRWQIAGSGLNRTLGILSETLEVFKISFSGVMIDRAQLRTRADFALRGDDLLVYTRGGLWTIDVEGRWSLLQADAPPGSDSAAVLATEGRTFLFDGTMLYAYNRQADLLWQLELEAVSGSVDLSLYGAALLLTSSGGSIIAVTDNGTYCNRVQLYGTDNALLWHQMGEDDILRVAVGSSLIGVDWQEFVRTCI